MNAIGGNITAQFQVKTEVSRDRLGSPVFDWTTVHEIKGFLDMSSGDSRYTSYNAKIQESSHIFICDYVPLSIKSSESRALIEGRLYDVKYIDDPMNLHEHLEIYLDSVGD